VIGDVCFVLLMVNIIRQFYQSIARFCILIKLDYVAKKSIPTLISNDIFRWREKEFAMRLKVGIGAVAILALLTKKD
jgi:hypothetical protein